MTLAEKRAALAEANEPLPRYLEDEDVSLLEEVTAYLPVQYLTRLDKGRDCFERLERLLAASFH